MLCIQPLAPRLSLGARLTRLCLGYFRNFPLVWVQANLALKVRELLQREQWYSIRTKDSDDNKASGLVTAHDWTTCGRRRDRYRA